MEEVGTIQPLFFCNFVHHNAYAMILKRLIFSLIFILAILNISAQLNQTDNNGLKQGPWVRTWPNGMKMYEGVFKDNKPVGEFRRYYQNGVLSSVMNFSEDGLTADAELYFQTGRLASKGRFVDRKKEGKWQFFSRENEGVLVSEEIYEDNMRNGTSLRYYPNGTLGERLEFRNDEKHGSWEQFHDNGKPYIKSQYSGGKLNGSYEAWFVNGNQMYSGHYKSDAREGLWLVYNEDGTVRYRINYKNGIPDNPQMDNDAAAYVDKLEKEKGRIPDPEITGEKW